VHRANAARLREIVAAHGWPGPARVGAEAASAAWRIVQHAIGEPAFLRAMLPVLAGAGADPAEVAKLEDRIRVHEGRPQRYGTQYDWDDTLTAMVPSNGVEDPATIDARRAAVGLHRSNGAARHRAVSRRPPIPPLADPRTKRGRNASAGADGSGAILDGWRWVRNRLAGREREWYPSPRYLPCLR
jgi:hypothetical protein